MGTRAFVTSRGGTTAYDGWYDWYGTSTNLSGPINTVRGALERFREVWSDYLDEVDDVDMAARLRTHAWQPDDFGSVLRSSANGTQKSISALQSKELRTLASRGATLYQTCFPPGSPLHTLLDALPLGARVTIDWTHGAENWVAHVPWNLMYRESVPVVASQLIDCQHFLGLRFRLSARAWKGTALGSSRALGHPKDVNGIHLLFWGTQPNDQVATEATWQKRTFGNWPRQTIVPSQGLQRKEQVVAALDAPAPAPAALLYFYCQASVGDGSAPELCFGDSKDDILTDVDLSQKQFRDSPLVFANACMTAYADPRGTSELEARFFRRGIRAFIGTETKVPVRLASRFAWLFFQFFYRWVTPQPVAAGEALTQARLFLYSQYGNIGGLFYSQTNGYDLYLASDEEIRSMHRGWLP